jgi:predicted naringenin-chalcone synthase
VGRLRIVGCATASPANDYCQDLLRDEFCRYLFGDDWTERPDVADQVHLITRLFDASGVERRQTAVEVLTYHRQPHSTGERMRDYERLAYPLAREALEACLEHAVQPARAVTDLIIASCTGYTAPGLDILLARDLGMRSDVRRLIIGHMGCHGAIIGLRNSLAALRAHDDAVVAMIAVELCSLHFNPKLDPGVLASLALFGDAAGALVLTACGGAQGPELVDTYCAADFDTLEQMSWKITDEGFLMGLSRRIPLTLRRRVDAVACQLLTPHGLSSSDIAHWIVHPGGPDILEVVANKLALSDEQIALSRQVLREHGNCSAPSVLLILDRLLRSGRPQPGEWGVMMAFGPGLTLETCLLRF